MTQQPPTEPPASTSPAFGVNGELAAEIGDPVERKASEQGSDFGRPGRPLDRSDPLIIGFLGALGVAGAYALVRLITDISKTLILVGLALFIAVGLEPLVAFLTRRNLKRGWAVASILVLTLGISVGFVASAVGPISQEATQVSKQLPQWRSQVEQGQGPVGHLASRLHLNSYFNQSGESRLSSTLTSGALGAGKAVLDLLSSVVVVSILSIYFLASLPALKRFLVRLAPASRRQRVSSLTDEILSRVGGFVLGNLFTSAVAGFGTLVWLEILHVPYAILLSLCVALFDLVPVVGSTVAGTLVSLVALSVSFPVAVATAGFYVAYRFLEDYLLTPRVMSRAVSVSPVVTVLATLIGGAALGIVGALVAIPIAAAIQLLLNESAFPRLDES